MPGPAPLSSNPAVQQRRSEGLLSVVADSAVKDVYYSPITDIKITKRNRGNSESYTTRVKSSANKVNLKFEDVLPAVRENLSASIAGIFAIRDLLGRKRLQELECGED